MIPVDVLTVLGPGREIHKLVFSALGSQGNVKLEHHIVDLKDNTNDVDYDHSIGSVVIYLGN